METSAPLERLARQAERIVPERLGRNILLHGPVLIAKRDRSLVVRCAVTGWDGIDSVVMKRNEGDDPRGFSDWAGLQFLSTLAEASGVAPCFHAGDATERLLIMEDLGGSKSLADVLDHADTSEALASLKALAACMGRLITATFDREEAYERLRAGLPGAEGLGRRREAARWLEARGKVADWAGALGIPLPRGFDAAYEHVAAVFADPGPYLAFSHGDPAPSNNHISPDRACLVDFEYAGYRHALYDITGWYVLCPLPDAWTAAMEKVFRQAAGARVLGDAIADDRRYGEAKATMCAYRALAMVTWFPPDLLVRDRDWTLGWSQRAALISTTLRLQRLCAGISALAPLADLGGALAEKLQARWPELGDGALHWPGVTK